MPRVVTLSPSQTQISTNKSAIDADGVEVCTVSVTVKNTDQTAGEPNAMSGLRGSAVTLAVTPSTGVTITQPTGVATANGVVIGSFVSTNATTVTVSATVLGTGATGGNPTVVVGGGTPTPPPSGDPFFEDTFSNGLRNNSNGFTWATTGSRVSVSATNPRSGQTHSIHMRYGPDASGADSTAEQRFNMGRELSELWVEYWLYIPANFVHRNDSPQNNKFLLFWRDVYSGPDNWRLGWEYTTSSGATPNSTIRGYSSRWDFNYQTDTGPNYSPTGQYSTFISPSGPLVPGSWHQIRVHLKAASSQASSDGIQRMWIDGVLYFSITNGRFWNFPTGTEPADCKLVNGYFMGWSNSGFTEETIVQVSEPKFYSSDPSW